MEEKQWRDEFVALDEPPAVKTSTIRITPAKPIRGVIPWKWIIIVFVLLSSLTGGLLVLRHLTNKPKPVASSEAQVKTQDVNLGNLADNNTPLKVDSANKVVINGELQANHNLILTPTTTDASGAQLGEVYIDAATKELRFFNGQSFVSLATTAALTKIAAQQQATEIQQQSLATGVVTSLQNSVGALTLAGTGGLTITAGGTSISLNLPQNLATTASPTFAGLSLSSPLTLSNGGTGRTSFMANGLVISDNSGLLQSLTDNTSGECLVSGAGTGGAPGFAACNGSTPVLSLDGLSGDLTIADSSGSGSTITINNASTSVKGIAQFNSTNFTVSAGVVNTIQNLSVSSSPTFAGLTLTTALSVANGGTGATNATAARASLSAAKSGVNSDITSTSNLNTISPSSALAVGSVNQQLTLQGNTNSIFRAISGSDGFTTVVGFSGVATGGVTYNFDRSATPGTYSICTSAGNCFGAGGVTTPGGTSGTIALFTGSQAIGNSILTQSGSTITIAQSGGTAGALSFKNNSNSNTIKFQAGTTAANLVFTLPTSYGNNGQCLAGTSSGVLSFQDCLTGAGGGGSGVSSLDGLSGVITINNSGGSGSNITIDDALADGVTKGIATFNSTNFSALSGVINTIQNISTSGTPQFAGLTLTGDLTLGTANSIKANNLLHTANGQDVTIDAGNDSITFKTNAGDSFVFPTGGGLGQEICTTGVNCVAGGGIAVNLAPNSVQTEASSNASIFINDTGGGNLLQLRSGGADKFVVNNSGTVFVDNLSTLSAGANNFTIVSGGRTFSLPTTGSASQTICTTGISCVSGGGQALILAPGTAQTNASATDSSVFINNTSTAKLLQLQSAGVDKFVVASSGNTTIGGSLAVSGLSSGIATVGGGGVLSSVTLVPIANGGTNASTAAIARSNLGAAQSGTNADITSTTVLNTITPNGALTVGATSQQFTLQGSSASSLTATSGSFKTTIGFAAPTANVAYNFAAAPAGTYNICSTAGNCSGVGGGVTTPGGTAGTIAAFTGAQSLGDSILSQSGSTLTIANGVGTAAALSFKNNTNSNTITLQSPSGASAPGSNLAFTLPSADGSANSCLTTNGSGFLIFQSCGIGGGGGGGVSFINSLSGSVTIANASTSGQTITIQDAASDGTTKGIATFNSGDFSSSAGVIDTIQPIALGSSPTFAGLTLTGTPLSIASGGTGANNASTALVNLGGAALGANSDITSTSALNTITPSSALTIGSTGQQFTLQGSSASTLTATSGSFTTTVGFATPTANVAYNFGAAAAGTYTICTTAVSAACSAAIQASGNFVNLQSSTPGTQQTGNLNISGSGLFGTALQTLALQSAASTALTISGHATSTWQTDAGNLTVQASAASSVLSLQAGSGGTVNLGTANDGLITIGQTTNCIGYPGSGYWNLAPQGICIGSGDVISAKSRDLYLNTGSAQNGQSGNINITTGDALNGIGGLIHIGTGKGTLVGSVIIQNAQDDISSFLVQTVAGNNVLTVDTANATVRIGNGNSQANLAFDAIGGGGSYNFIQDGFNATAGQLFFYLPKASEAGGRLCTDNAASACSITGDGKYLSKISPDVVNTSSVFGGFVTKFINSGSVSGSNAVYIQNNGTGQTLSLSTTSGYYIFAGINGANLKFAVDAAGQVRFGTASNHTISVDAPSTGTAGLDLSITSGASGPGGTNTAGGDLNLTAGSAAAANSGIGGNVAIKGGVSASGAGSAGGQVTINGGGLEAGSAGLVAGAVSLTGGNAGSATANGFGGAVNITGGSGYFRDGGDVLITGGNSGGSGSNGGNVEIEGGNHASNGVDGNIILGATSAADILLGSAVDCAKICVTGSFVVNGGTNINTSITSSTAGTHIGNNTGGLTLTSPTWDLNSAGALSGLTQLTMSSGAFLQSGSGTFDTGTGTVGLNGNVTISANHTFLQSGTGTFGTGSGNVSLNGPVTASSTISATGNISTTTGAFRIGANSINVAGTLTNVAYKNAATTFSNTLTVTLGTTLSSTLTVAGVTQINNTLTVTGLTTLGTLTAGVGTFTGIFTVNGHIVSGNSSGSTTIAATTAQCGTGCTASISGNDTAGLITINTGTGVTAGTLATVTFGSTYGSAPRITLTPETVPAASNFPQYYYGVTATTFDLKAYNALTDSKTYTFSYHIIK